MPPVSSEASETSPTSETTAAPTRRTGWLAAGLIAGGILLMVLPPLARDGVCGLLPCADQVPDIAVARGAENRLEVLVPGASAPAVQSVRVLAGGGQGTGSEQWLIERTGEADHDAFVVGDEPEGFSTVRPLEVLVDRGQWWAEVQFGCTVASLPFEPASLDPGDVVDGKSRTTEEEFRSSASIDERCQTSASGAEKAMLGLGALLTTVGAGLGIVVVLRRPARIDEEWLTP